MLLPTKTFSRKSGHTLESRPQTKIQVKNKWSYSMDGERVRCSTLRGSMLPSWAANAGAEFMQEIEKDVQHVSLMDTLGCMVYTTCLLRRLRQNLDIYPEYLDQTFWNNCVSSITSDRGQPPGNVSMGHATEAKVPNYNDIGDRAAQKAREESTKRRRVDENKDDIHQRITKARDTAIAKARKQYEKKVARRSRQPEMNDEINAAGRTIRSLLPRDFTLPDRHGRFHQRNESGRLYLTNVKNNIWMTIYSRQRRVIDLQVRGLYYNRPKKFYPYLTAMAARKVNGVNFQVDERRYADQDSLAAAKDALQDQRVQDLVAQHKQQLPDFNEPNIKKHPHLYLKYQYFLLTTIEAIRRDLANNGDQKLPKAFRIIPQLSYRARSVTYSNAAMGDLMARVSILKSTGCECFHDGCDNAAHGTDDYGHPCCRSHRGVKSATAWRVKVADLSSWYKRFRVPRVSGGRAFSGTITTNGVKVSWHYKLPGGAKTKKRKRSEANEPSSKSGPIRTIASSHMKVGIHGLHGRDILINSCQGQTYMSVDPGHKVLMHAVATVPCDVTADPHHGVTSRRRCRKQEKLKQQGLTEFKLGNGVWRHSCKRDWYRQKLTNLHNWNLRSAIDNMSTSPLVFDNNGYLHYITTKLAHLPDFSKVCGMLAPRRWSFETYKAEQRAANKLRADVRSLIGPKGILLWGAGGFGPTSKGHDSAPNKKLRSMLGRGFPIVMVSETNTSKTSSCCHSGVHRTSRHPNSTACRRRADVLVCDNCSQLLSRDMMAAKNILSIFQYQVNNSGSSPDWATL